MIDEKSFSFEHSSLEDFKTSIELKGSVVIVPHKNPDGDALGAALGLKIVLQNIGCKVSVISPNKPTAYLDWLPEMDSIIIFEQQSDIALDAIRNADLICVVDFNCLKRIDDLGSAIEAAQVRKVMIDHHPYPDPIADLMFSDISVSSTCELVCRLMHAVDKDEFIDQRAATCFYTGIMTDTGSLSYNSSNPLTYYIVADLLSKNIDKAEIHQLVFHSNSLERMRLLGYCLSDKMIVVSEQRMAYFALTEEELKRFNFQPGDTEGFVNYPLGITGIDVSVFFMEREGKIKISFRSRGDIPVNEFSEQNFGGGGHMNAAGGECEDGMDVTLDKFRAAFNHFAQKYNLIK